MHCGIRNLLLVNEHEIFYSTLRKMGLANDDIGKIFSKKCDQIVAKTLVVEKIRGIMLE